MFLTLLQIYKKRCAGILAGRVWAQTGPDTEKTSRRYFNETPVDHFVHESLPRETTQPVATENVLFLDNERDRETLGALLKRQYGMCFEYKRVCLLIPI